MSPRAVPLLLLAAACALAPGCSSREPTRPAAVTPNYAAVDSSLHMMSLGLSRKDAVGQALYIGALADSSQGDPVDFVAVFDWTIWRQWTGPKPAYISDWHRRNERSFYDWFVLLFPGAYRMTWSAPIGPDEVRGSDVGYVRTLRNYVVRDGTSNEILATGQAELTFLRRADGRWVLALWVDHVAPDVGYPPRHREWQSFTQRRLESYR